MKLSADEWVSGAVAYAITLSIVPAATREGAMDASAGNRVDAAPFCGETVLQQPISLSFIMDYRATQKPLKAHAWLKLHAMQQILRF